MSLRDYLIHSPSAIADLLITLIAVVMLIYVTIFARKPKDEPEEMDQPAGVWPPAPAGDR